MGYISQIFHCHFTESVLSLSDESYDLGVIDKSREVFSGLGAKISGKREMLISRLPFIAN